MSVSEPISGELLVSEEYPPIRVTDRVSIPNWKLISTVAYNVVMSIVSVVILAAVGISMVASAMRFIAEIWTK